MITREELTVAPNAKIYEGTRIYMEKKGK